MTHTAGVVVIGRNVGPRLRSSLTSVLELGYPLVYVDSGSTDDNLQYAKDLDVCIHALSSERPFSAARGRNEGFLRLLENHPNLEAVLFLDGDCTIDEQVIPAGLAALKADEQLALVCSPVRETDRNRDVWKLLCDLEWDQPAGPIDHCGGIFLIRVTAYRDIGGMDASVIAGEEPEMCLQLTRKGWNLLRIDHGLVLHDVGEFGFRQWWVRSKRSGLAFLLGFMRDGSSADRQNLRETLRPWIWGVALPITVLGLCLWLHPLWALLLLAYPLQLIRMMIRLHSQGRSWHAAWIYSVFNLLGRWAEVAGQIGLLFSIASGSAESPHDLRNSPIRLAATPAKNRPRSTPSIGVVIIGRNEGERLLSCLHSVASTNRNIVYVDSGSTDKSTDFARRLGVSVVDLDMSTPFTAARARNEGFQALYALNSELDYVQFVDGDCSVDPAWIDTAARVLFMCKNVVAVSGRRREQHPDVSVYNRLADREWDTALGPVKWCGGDVLMRASALHQVSGYNPDLIACEEPELCFRLRAQGWIILRINAEMTQHDADITHFSQWWKRSTRTGYSYCQAAALHRGKPGRFLHREIRSGIIWGMGFPILIFSCFFVPWMWLVFALTILVQAIRIQRRNTRNGESEPIAPLFAIFSVLINLPIAVGMLRYRLFRLLGKESTLIEYK